MQREEEKKTKEFRAAHTQPFFYAKCFPGFLSLFFCCISLSLSLAIFSILFQDRFYDFSLDYYLLKDLKR
jgi:hypothetical protein